MSQGIRGCILHFYLNISSVNAALITEEAVDKP